MGEGFIYVLMPKCGKTGFISVLPHFDLGNLTGIVCKAKIFVNITALVKTD